MYLLATLFALPETCLCRLRRRAQPRRAAPFALASALLLVLTLSGRAAWAGAPEPETPPALAPASSPPGDAATGAPEVAGPSASAPSAPAPSTPASGSPADANDEAAFFANLAKQPGIIELGGGAYARELQAGNAPAVPNAELVVVNLASRPLRAAALGADGEVAAHERHVQRYVVGQLPGALQAAVQRMQIGARWEVLVPHQGGAKAKRGRKEKVLPATVFTLELISAH